MLQSKGPPKNSAPGSSHTSTSKCELGTFVNPSSDWGFKRILSDPSTLVDFLNAFLPPGREVTEAKLIDKEHLATSPDDRTVIFDVHAVGVDNKKFIIGFNE